MAKLTDLQKGYAQKYVTNMLRKGLIKGKDVFTITEDGVVLSQRYGGGAFSTVNEAYEAIYMYFFYPKAFKELYLRGS